MKNLRAAIVVLAFSSVAAFVYGCSSSSDGGAGAVGTTCSQSGAAEQCAAGAVCGKPSDGTTSLQCLKTCTQQTDCPADQDCNGVEGSSAKGCRPKSGSDGGTDSGKK